MREIFDQFLKEKRYLTNVSPQTIKYYEWMYNRWNHHIGKFPTKENIKEFVIKIRESDITVYTANSYIRGINSFLSWLYENEYTKEHLKIKKLKEPEKFLKLFSDEQIKRLLNYRPKTFAQKRLYAMICFAFDTGARIEEILNLRREDIDFDNLLVLVTGKGDKERILPISIECRKHLYKFLRLHEYQMAFPKRNGERQSYRTALQLFKTLCKKLHITGVRTSWHTIRHTMASHYVRDGGNVLYLQRILGHSDLSVTKIYVKALPEDLKLVHKKTSLVGRYK
ncbi:MAG: tyrosine-type recombinase/integrase [Pyrinomonadaceae bacterium]